MFAEGIKFRIPVYELLIIALVTVVPISIVGLYSLSQSDQSLHETIGNDFRIIAESRANEVFQFILERVGEMGKLATEPPVVDAVALANKSYVGMSDAAVAAKLAAIDKSWNNAPVDPVVDAILASRLSVWLRTFRDLDPRILRITVTDAKGAIIAVTHKPTRYAQADEEYWGKIYADGDGAVSLSDIRYDEVTKTDYIGIGWPVRDDTSNRFIGAVNALVDVSAVASFVNDPQGSVRPRILLVKDDGILIAARNTRFWQRIKSPEFAAIKDAVGPLGVHQAGYIVASFPDGGSQLIGFADSGLKQDYENFGWVVLVCQDTRQAFGAIRLVERMIALVSGIGLFMVSLLVAYFAMHRKQPITEIGELAHEPPLVPAGGAKDESGTDE